MTRQTIQTGGVPLILPVGLFLLVFVGCEDLSIESDTARVATPPNWESTSCGSSSRACEWELLDGDEVLFCPEISTCRSSSVPPNLAGCGIDLEGRATIVSISWEIPTLPGAPDDARLDCVLDYLDTGTQGPFAYDLDDSSCAGDCSETIRAAEGARVVAWEDANVTTCGDVRLLCDVRP